jgi:transposase
MAAPVGPKKVNRYTVEFKIQAVKLSSHPEFQTQDVAKALDIHPFMLSKWKKDYRRCCACPGSTPRSARSSAG